MQDEWVQRARSFGQVAELYERWRPGYPDALYADVLKLGPGGRVLEAGAGTERATLALALRGVSVVAVEPDSAMAAVARRRTVGMAVTVQESTFEDWTAEAGSFDLVVAARRGIGSTGSVAGRSRPVRCVQVARCAYRPRELGGLVWDAIHAAWGVVKETATRRQSVAFSLLNTSNGDHCARKRIVRRLTRCA